MKSLLLVLILLGAGTVTAQPLSPALQTIVAQDAGVACSVSGSCAAWQLLNQPTITIQITGSCSCTLTFETTIDGQTWFAAAATNLFTGTAATTTTTTGQYSLANTGMASLRVRATAFASGGMNLKAAQGSSSLARINFGTTGSSETTVTTCPAFGTMAGNKACVRIGTEGNTGAGQDDTGDVFRVELNANGVFSRPALQVSRGGGVRVYDFFMVFPYSTTNSYFPQVFGSEAFMIGAASDLSASGSTAFFSNNANHHDLLRLADFVSWNGTTYTTTRRLTFSGAGVMAFGESLNTVPALKANGADLNVRLGDDSADATLHSATIAVGTNPSASGTVRVPNNSAVAFRNSTNTGDLNGLYLDNSNILQVGDTGTVNIVTARFSQGGNLLHSSVSPTISSGFGSSPSITNANGATTFSVNVGTGGVASSGVVGMPTATTGWTCAINDRTAAAGHTAYNTRQTATSTTSVSVENQTTSTGAAIAWAASDILTFLCFPY